MHTYEDENGVLRKEGKYPLFEWIKKCRANKNGVLKLRQGKDYDALSTSTAKYLRMKLKERGVQDVEVDAFPDRQIVQLRIQYAKSH